MTRWTLILLDVLVCSMAVYFYDVVVFWQPIQIENQRMKILSDAIHQNFW